MIKMWQESLLFLQFVFVSSRTIVINSNINPGGPPPQFNFCLPILMYNPDEIKSSYPKNYYLRPSSNRFMNVMQ